MPTMFLCIPLSLKRFHVLYNRNRQDSRPYRLPNSGESGYVFADTTHVRRSVFIFALVLSFAASSLGDDFVWDGGGASPTDFVDPLNWDHDSDFPQLEDSASFPLASQTVWLTSDAVVGTVTISAGVLPEELTFLGDTPSRQLTIGDLIQVQKPSPTEAAGARFESLVLNLASSDATLQLAPVSSGPFDDGSVTLRDATILGGTIGGRGRVIAEDGATLDGVTLGGVAIANLSDTLTLRDVRISGGEVAIGPFAADAPATATFSSSEHFIVDDEAGFRLFPGQTANLSGEFVNHGKVGIEGVESVISLHVNANADTTVRNGGRILVENGGRMDFTGNSGLGRRIVVDNTGGSLTLNQGSTMHLIDGTTSISGGTVQGPGNVQLDTATSLVLLGVTLDGLTIDSDGLISAEGAGRIQGNVTLNGGKLEIGPADI